MKGWRWFVIVALAVAVALWARDLWQRQDDAKAGSGRALGIYLPDRSADLREEARRALEQDARRRESRFLDAAQSGRALTLTRASQASIEAGSWPVRELYQLGAQLFHQTFTRAQGLGDPAGDGLRRIHRGAEGGPDAYRCADCHRKGGIAGAGDASDNAYLDGDGADPASALERNPIPLHGAGLVELLGREMSAELERQRAELVNKARSSDRIERAELSAKGVAFGHVSASPTGELDFSGLRGVDRDLVVKPFGWKGHVAALRDMVEEELTLHHGMLTKRAADGIAQRAGPVKIVELVGAGEEIDEGQLTALTLFAAMQELPRVEMPEAPELVALWPDGQRLFEKIGCASCHVPSLPLSSPVFELPSRDGRRSVRVDLSKDGADPRLVASPETGKYQVALFSDLKRHVVGSNLRELKSHRGVSQAEFLTRPLWGLARSRPYLHDGRAPTIEAAILAHSGEAEAARTAYAALSDAERAPLRIYLVSLTRAPRIGSP